MGDAANEIHPTAIIGTNVQLGTGNVIGPYCVIDGPVTIGDDNRIGPHVCIGTPGQDTGDRDYDTTGKRVEIGSRNHIREFTAIQKPCYTEVTRIGDGVYLMQSVHVPHDAMLDDGVVCTPMVALAGSSRVMTFGYLAMGATVHQNSVIGPYSIVATGAAVTKNVRPFSKYIPGRPVGLNEVAIERQGFSQYRDEIEAYLAEGRIPEPPQVRCLVERYEELHANSGRKQY